MRILYTREMEIFLKSLNIMSLIHSLLLYHFSRTKEMLRDRKERERCSSERRVRNIKLTLVDVGVNASPCGFPKAPFSVIIHPLSF